MYRNQSAANSSPIIIIADSKLLDDDDSLPEEPVKMKPSLEVEKGQESVVFTIIEGEFMLIQGWIEVFRNY